MITVSEAKNIFAAMVDEADKDKCWQWKGCTARGYGIISFKGKSYKAHRISMYIEKGEMPPANLVVCHKCDNPTCVNPNHLFVGTTQDNQTDMKNKGRSLYGERNGNCKTTEYDVKRMRIMRAFNMPRDRIAKAFGMSETHTSRILKKEVFSYIASNLDASYRYAK